MHVIEDDEMAYGQGGWRRRNIYRLTGLPGWMRFGYSPGWVGRNPAGSPSTAQYLIQAGQAPRSTPPAQTVAPTHENCVYFKDGFCTLRGVQVDSSTNVCPNFTPKSLAPAPETPSTRPTFQATAGFLQAQIPRISKEQEIQMLESQARMVKQRLEQIKRRFKELEKEVK